MKAEEDSAALRVSDADGFCKHLYFDFQTNFSVSNLLKPSW